MLGDTLAILRTMRSGIDVLPMWEPVVPVPFDSEQEANVAGIAAAERVAESSGFKWERYGSAFWQSQPDPMLPCDLLVGSVPHSDGWWPVLSLSAGVRGGGRYWQFSTHQGSDTHIPLEVAPSAMVVMLETYLLLVRSEVWHPSDAERREAMFGTG